MKIIECKDMVKSFGHPPVTILKSLNFSVDEGEFLSVTGRSGSGKSTLLYTVSGLDPLTSGSVFVLGEEVHRMPSRETHEFRNQKIGFVFQFHYLLPELTAFENILMPARKIKMEKQKASYAVELMHEFEIEKCKDKTPAQMSGGELQRTSIARSLIMEPRILFADEPTGNLDSENGERVMHIFEKINKNLSTTIIMVTHESDFAKRARRTIHLTDGVIESDVVNISSKRKK
ncbi:MAG: ABC transporter ATP-binding protein [Spirochaetes bacterium]|nr:ABC transporter ATP-binding protein [Spirochaetota bacterium]